MTLPSISVDDDAGSPIDLNALSDLAGHVYSTMHIHPDSELGITLVDIGICPDFGQADAAAAERSLDEHVQFLTVHGLLHLLGYDHATEEEYARMFALQDELLDSWGAAR